jgi:prepilin-type processing-associated H-X9-DG protein
VLKQPGIYKCPADRSCASGSVGPPRMRSISMSQAIGYNSGGATSGQGAWLPSLYGNNGVSGGPYQVYFKESDLGRPGPSGLWLFIDENPDTINDGAWAFTMPSGSATSWVDEPAKLHGNAGGFGFVDGHAEIHGWHNPQAIPTTVYHTGAPGQVPINNNKDVYWVATRTSAPVSGPYPFPTQ